MFASARWTVVAALVVVALSACSAEETGGGGSGGDGGSAGGSGGGSAGGSGGGGAAGGAGSGGATARPADWNEATHGKDTPPAYDLLFSMDQVRELRITIAPADYAAMMANLEEIVPAGGIGVGGAGGPGPGGAGGGGFEPPQELIDACVGLEAGAACSFVLNGAPGTGTCEALMGPTAMCIPAGGPGGPGGPGGTGGAGGPIDPGGGGVELLTGDPIWVPVDVAFEGERWHHVGMRFKGNSSLASLYGEGNRKLPFRLAFDKYEEEFPAIDDQRFHGFQKLTFSSNWSDDSQIREAFVAELLRDRGIPAARASFLRVLVDVGDGETYWGLYTMVEDPADGAMLDAQLGGSDGNLYKPDGVGADWTTFDPDGFEKKSNESAADFSDVERAIAALNASRADPAAWRADLDAAFDTHGFLRWLAVNTVIQNWDSYGQMAHNYYLYAAPSADGRLVWIPWDHNLSMAATIGGFGGAVPAGAVDELFHANVGAQWPLISLLLADDEYRATYRQALEAATAGLGAPEAAAARLRALHDLVAPSVVGPAGEEPGSTTISSAAAFDASVDGPAGLAAYMSQRKARVDEALAPP